MPNDKERLVIVNTALSICDTNCLFGKDVAEIYAEVQLNGLVFGVNISLLQPIARERSFGAAAGERVVSTDNGALILLEVQSDPELVPLIEWSESIYLWKDCDGHFSFEWNLPKADK